MGNGNGVDVEIGNVVNATGSVVGVTVMLGVANCIDVDLVRLGLAVD